MKITRPEIYTIRRGDFRYGEVFRIFADDQTATVHRAEVPKFKAARAVTLVLLPILPGPDRSADTMVKNWARTAPHLDGQGCGESHQLDGRPDWTCFVETNEARRTVITAAGQAHLIEHLVLNEVERRARVPVNALSTYWGQRQNIPAILFNGSFEREAWFHELIDYVWHWTRSLLYTGHYPTVDQLQKAVDVRTRTLTEEEVCHCDDTIGIRTA